MLIVCPNCATSYGVEMASLRPARGWTRKLRCHHCRRVWQAQLSNTDKLLVAADAVPPVRRAMAAIAQAAADAARSALPRLRRATAVLAEELEAARTRVDRAPIPPTGLHDEPAGADLARVTVTPLIEGISAIAARVVGAIRAPALVPILAPVLVAVLAAVLAAVLVAVLVAVAPVTVTLAVRYSRTCAY